MTQLLLMRKLEFEARASKPSLESKGSALDSGRVHDGAQPPKVGASAQPTGKGAALWQEEDDVSMAGAEPESKVSPGNRLKRKRGSL